MDYDKLIVETSKGDMESLEKLYRDLSPAVYALALSILRSRALAEDVLQDTFVRVKLSAASYKPGTKGRAWILKIARNLSISALRSKALVQYNDEIEALAGSIDHTQKSINSIIIRESLSKLEEQERQIVLLHALKDLRHREIAEILELPLGTVLWKYRRAIKRLGEYLNREQ